MKKHLAILCDFGGITWNHHFFFKEKSLKWLIVAPYYCAGKQLSMARFFAAAATPSTPGRRLPATRGSLDVDLNPWLLAGPVQFWTRWRHVTVTSSTLIDHILEALKKKSSLQGCGFFDMVFSGWNSSNVRNVVCLFSGHFNRFFGKAKGYIQMDMGKVEKSWHTFDLLICQVALSISSSLFAASKVRIGGGVGCWAHLSPQKTPLDNGRNLPLPISQIRSGADCSRPCPCILAGSKSGIPQPDPAWWTYKKLLKMAIFIVDFSHEKWVDLSIADPMEAADVCCSTTGDLNTTKVVPCINGAVSCWRKLRPEMLEIDVGRCAMVVARKGRSGQWEVHKLFRCIMMYYHVFSLKTCQICCNLLHRHGRTQPARWMQRGLGRYLLRAVCTRWLDWKL